MGSNLRTSGRRFLGGAGAERRLGVGKNQVNWGVAKINSKIVGQNINRRRRIEDHQPSRGEEDVGEEGEHPVHQRVQLDEALT